MFHSFSLGLQGLAHTTERLSNEATIPGNPPPKQLSSADFFMFFRVILQRKDTDVPMSSLGLANKERFNEAFTWSTAFWQFKHI